MARARNPKPKTGQPDGNGQNALATQGVPDTFYQALSSSPEEMTEFLRVIKANLGADKITERDLDRIVLPAGGSRQWEVPTLDGSEYSEAIEGIIIHHTLPRARWETDLEEGGIKSPPDCSSPDGITGYGDPGGDCFTCQFNEWGSANRGEGKACKEKRMLFVLRPTDILPVVVQAPTTSLQPVKKYFLRLVQQAPPQRFYHCYTRLELEKVEANPFDYSRIVLRSTGPVPTELREQLDNYIQALVPRLTVAVQQDE